MKHIIKNAKLVDILKQRKELFESISSVNDKMVELDKERTKLAYKMDKLKDKTKVIMDKAEIKLNEFEVISAVSLEKGEAVATVVNQIDEYKRMLREKETN